VQSNRSLNETVGGMNLMSSSANQVQELGLRAFIETWVEPVLRIMVKLEGLYETDRAIMALGADYAEIDGEVSDEDLMQDLVVKVNVGMGNTNPQQKMERFMQPLQAASQFPDMLAEFDTLEIGKELFALSGQGDGERFMLDEEKKKERAEQQGDQTPPEIQVKMAEMELRKAELQFEQQSWQADQELKTQAQRFDQQFQSAKLQSDQELARQEMALKQGLTMAQLEAKLGLDSQKLELEAQKTAAGLQSQRDIKAAELVDKQNERAARQKNQDMGFDSY
jgi:hypothetical protein